MRLRARPLRFPDRWAAVRLLVADHDARTIDPTRRPGARAGRVPDGAPSPDRSCHRPAMRAQALGDPALAPDPPCRTGRARMLVICALLPAALLSAACGTTTTPGTSGGSAAPTAARPSELTVGAAASLSEALSDLGPSATVALPGTSLTYTFDASSSLVRQLESGAPLDVLVTADEATMAVAAQRGLVVPPAVAVARNRLTLVVPEGNPAGVTGLRDLDRLDVVALCGPEVPCGRASERVLAAAGVTLDPARVTRGQNVRSTLTAVSEGGAQAGLVYATDAAVATAAVDEVPAAVGVEGEVVVMAAVTTTTNDRTAADAYLDLLRNGAGRSAFAARGFGLP